jgi:hypothetical protein
MSRAALAEMALVPPVATEQVAQAAHRLALQMAEQLTTHRTQQVVLVHQAVQRILVQVFNH